MILKKFRRMEKILVAGGCGYIGSHTIVDLVQKGFEVISIDNFSRSDKKMLEGVRKITGKEIVNYEIDLCDLTATKKVFEENNNITGIIHFAAFKSVPDSVKDPILYYHNNIESLNSLLKFCERKNIQNFMNSIQSLNLF